MRPIYSNDFSKPDPDNTAFAPETDTGLSSTNPVINALGDMYAGFSHQVPRHPNKAATPPGSSNPANIPAGTLLSDLFPISDPPGIRLEMNLNTASPQAVANSKTMYLTNLQTGSGFFLPIGSQLTAEIVFDRPDAEMKADPYCDSMTHPQFKWALALVLKSGDQDEYPDDKIMGPSCQFFNSGDINFHGTDYYKPGTDPKDQSTCPQKISSGKTYQQYGGTTLTMSLSIWRNRETRYTNGPSLGGRASLALIRVPGTQEVYSGNLATQDKRLKMPDGKTPVPYTNLDWVDSLGVSLVCAKNDLAHVSIRLKKFTISVTPRPSS